MKQITNKEYEEWQKYKAEKAKSHVLLPDTVRFICEANGYDAEKIGQHFLKSCRKSASLNRDNENASEPMWFRGVAASMELCFDPCKAPSVTRSVMFPARENH